MCPLLILLVFNSLSNGLGQPLVGRRNDCRPGEFVTVHKMIGDEITFFLRELGWIYFYLHRAMGSIDAATEAFRLIDRTQYFHCV